MEFIERGSQRSRSLPVLRLFQGKEAKRPAPSDEASTGKYLCSLLFVGGSRSYRGPIIALCPCLFRFC
jgi:hypothetical protein